MEGKMRNLENWQDVYASRLVSPEVAAGAVKSGDNIFIPASYYGLMPNAIVARAGELRDVTVEVQAPRSDPGWLSPGMEASFNMIARIFLHSARVGHDEGRISFIPYTNHTWWKPYRDNRPGIRDIDVFLVEVTPPDEYGFCNFGPWLWERQRYAKRAKIVIAEIDHSLTRNCGDTSIHVSEIDYLVEAPVDPLKEAEIEKVVGIFVQEKQDRARREISLSDPKFIRNLISVMDEVPVERMEFVFNLDEGDDVAKAIANNLKTVLRDRDTIQIGVGKPSRLMVTLGAFDDLHDLSIFSEMACPGMAYLVKRGIVNGRYASLHPGKAVFTGLGVMSREETLWTNNNPLFELYSSDYVVNIANISKNENMIAINNAVQIDLTGQITAESQFGPRLINGPGGQIEFHMGAFMAPGGRAVTLLPSTWGDGGVSTIVKHLAEGSLVTIPRAYADIVITEWGVAQLAGKTHHERAQELIKVAHPDFRAELTKAAQDIW